MRKKPILRFLVRLVVTLQLPVWLSTKIFKSQYLGFCSFDLKNEDSAKKYPSRESMVKKPFLYFECFTYGNPCDSSTFPRDNFWPVTPEKIVRHGFSIFLPKYSISSRVSMKVTFWLINLEKYPLNLKHPS